MLAYCLQGKVTSFSVSLVLLQETAAGEEEYLLQSIELQRSRGYLICLHILFQHGFALGDYGLND